METGEQQNKPQQIVVTADDGQPAAPAAAPEFAGGVTRPSQHIVPPVSEPDIVTLRFHPHALIHGFDWIFDRLRRLISPPAAASLASSVANYGHIAMLAAQVLALLFFLIAGSHMDQPVLIGKGIVVVILLGALQYVAGRLIEAGSPLLASCPAKLRSSALPNSVAVLSVVLGIGCFAASVSRAAETDASLLWVGIGGLLVFLGASLLALHPSLLTIRLDPDISAPEEAIGVLSYLPRLAVRTALLAFGVGAFAGAVGLLFGTIMLDLNTVNWTLGFVFFCESLPLVSYVAFSLSYLVLEVARAILRHAP